ncbi:MAG: protein kinase [Actinomycetota bacterium]
MKSKTWNKVERIFHTALDLPVEERTFFLQKQCAGDGELLSEVETLLVSFEKESGFLEEPVFEIGLGAIHQKSQKNLADSIIGFYELKEKIGAGGMGEVYKAVDTRLNRRVALKFLSAALENDNSAKRQFVKEAQAVAMLEHPNICAVHGIEQTDDHHFIVMQYVEGITLAEKIETERVGVEEFKSLTRQILTAVAFAHSHGVIHRDLKPGNIMLTREGQIKVLDFGLAKVIPQKQIFGGELQTETSRFSNNGLIIGTVSYMSPEQLRGERLDYRSDVFSIGIILYELITKQNPFDQKSQADTIASILSDQPPALKNLAPDFPASLKNLVEKCLQKKPEQRFQSAAEILVKLDLTETGNISAILKRRRSFFLNIAFAAVVFFAVLAIIFFYTGQHRQRTLAVLPISFDNPPAGKEYLAGGLTESIIDKLSNLSDLKVKNKSIVDRFKDKAIEPQIAGKELGVDAVFAGTIQKRANELFLVTKIIRTSDSFIIDTDESKIEEASLIELQENISARIISKLKSNLTDDDKNKLAQKETENNEAKRLYLLGRAYMNRREGNDLKNAIRSFNQATAIDIKYAKAWTGLADSYLFTSLPDNKNAIAPKEAINYAKSAAKKALELDNTLCETYNSFGMIGLKYDWKWNEAESYFRTAIDCDSEFLPARYGLISVLQITGRFDEALQEAQKVKVLDPLSISSDLTIASLYYGKRDYQRMDKVISDLLERYPSNNRISYIRSYQFLLTRKYQEATEILEKMYNSDKESEEKLASAPLGFAYAKMGRRKEALKIIETLERMEKNNYVPPQEKAIIYVGLGDFDKAFENLNKSCDERFPSLPTLIFSPLLDEIKSDARFADIKKCVNLQGELQ